MFDTICGLRYIYLSAGSICPNMNIFFRESIELHLTILMVKTIDYRNISETPVSHAVGNHVNRCDIFYKLLKVSFRYKP